MTQTDLINAVTASMQRHPHLQGIFLSGSFGSEQNDAWSDVDFLALCLPEHQDQIADQWVEAIRSVEPIILERRRPFGRLLVNLVTQNWLRADLHITNQKKLRGQGKSGLKAIYDPNNMIAEVPAEPAVSGPNPLGLTEEFIRVLGLLSVAIGREDYNNAITGLFHMRAQFISLMVLASNDGPTGGALHLNRLLTEDQQNILAGLPIPLPEKQAIIDAHYKYAQTFLPLARNMLTTDWPQEFETATLTHLARQLDPKFGTLLPKTGSTR